MSRSEFGSTPSFTDAVRKARAYRDTSWDTYGRTITEYDGYFSEVLHGKSIVELVTSKEEPVVVDIMAPSGTLADLFSKLPQSKKYGVALSYEDLRTDEEKERDVQLNIQQVNGDITTAAAWNELEKTLDGRKADLVVQRPMGGIACVPVHRQYYKYAMSKMWDMSSDQEGTILVQLPTIETLESVDISISEWVKDLNDNDIEAESHTLENVVSNAFITRLPLSKVIPSTNELRLVKRPDSLKVLPTPKAPEDE